ncbi:MAG TPA: hypothetical protein ENK57_03310 [Polyangiaceae bacterium]|nr:hypothetical protein [Polyangiaceae bacterium]
MKTATWMKLRSGEWGVKVNSAQVREGDKVVAIKRNGERKEVKIRKVLWAGDGKAICAIDRGKARTYRRRSTWARDYEDHADCGTFGPCGPSCDFATTGRINTDRMRDLI